MKQPLLSIIIPAYNAEKTIGQLIESIVNQDYKDYELIILNDGSKDKTKEVVLEYAKKYKVIKFIDKKNTGVGDTRNQGINISSGKYIVFADSDDYLMSDYFEKIIPEIKKEDFELLVFNALVMNYGKVVGDEISNKYSEGSFIEENAIIRFLKGDFSYRITNVPWNKVYISKIIKDNHLKFEVNKKRGEDFIFNVLYTSKISKYRYVNEKLYVYNLNYDPLKSDLYFNDSIDNILEFYNPLKKICLDNNINNWERYVALFFLKKFMGLLLNEIKCPNKKQGLEQLKKYLSNEDIHYILKKIKIRDLNFKQFITFVLYKFHLYKMVYYILWSYCHKNKRGAK